MARPFTPAWLAGEPAATQLLPCLFRDPAARVARTQAARRAVPPEVIETLRALNPECPEDTVRALANGTAAAVVTGQQVGLFLGPLYVVHKAATAIAVARQLEAEAKIPVVPVFWLQTEDADFEEVRTHCAVDPAGTLVRQRLADPFEAVPAGDRVSVAHRPLGPSVDDALGALAPLLGPLRHGEEVLALLARHYRPDRQLPEAFAGLLQALFAESGLLVIDPRHPALAALHAPLVAHALTAHGALDDALGERALAISEAGFDVQVPHRPGASLLCLHPDGPEGPRYRLVRDSDGAFTAAGGPSRRWTEAELLALARSSPHSFSTTALLRPLLQDTLLPTAAYVGGPGELAYYAEMPPLYAAFDLTPPLLVPRARFRLITAAARRCAEHLGVSLDVPLDADAVLAAATPAEPPALIDAFAAMRAATDALRRPVDAAVSALAREDAGLPKAATRAFSDIEGALQKLGDRLARARLQADGVKAQRARRLLALLQPDGSPQERVLGFATFAAEVGPRALAAQILAAVRPFDGALHDLELQ